MRKKPTRERPSDRITYRDLRNTPGQVYERLANNEILTLVADGEPKAILVPVESGDVRLAYEAYARGRAMLAASRMRRSARESGAGAMNLDEINALIRATRAARRKKPGRSR
jgi:antitoxin (DNA-binding transcriptional repressor) of toxin-antitoxin stability system